MELYLHSPIRLHGVVLSLAQGQRYLYLFIKSETNVMCVISAELVFAFFMLIVVQFAPGLVNNIRDRGRGFF
jgi:hypothetical protein